MFHIIYKKLNKINIMRSLTNTTINQMEKFGYISMYNQLKAWQFLSFSEETIYGDRLSNVKTLQGLLFRKSNNNIDEKRKLSPQVVSLVEAIRSYQELLPPDDRIREVALTVISDNKLADCAPYNGIKHAHTSVVYQPIDTKKVVEAFIDRGIYPISVKVLKPKKTPSLFETIEDKEKWESQQYHIVRFLDHATLTGKYSGIVLALFRETGLLPVIELHNAHDGKHACFMILTMVNPFDNSKNKTNIYPHDDSENSSFGVRLEHRNLGLGVEELIALKKWNEAEVLLSKQNGEELYEQLHIAIESISNGYTQLYRTKLLLDQYRLTPQEKSILLKEIETLLFKYQNLKSWDWTPLFDGWRSKDGTKKTDDNDDYSFWHRLLHIQEVLYRGVSYTITDKNGKDWKKKKKLENQSMIENEYNQRKIYGYLFKLFMKFAEERRKK